MIVNFEFLAVEPLENVITCMHYAVDKVVFFGYDRIMDIMEEKTSRFLKKRCQVKEVEYVRLPREDFQKVKMEMRQAILREIAIGNECYFDITGGDSLILVAFGQLSKVLNCAMHMYDVAEDRLVEFEESGVHLLSNARKRKVQMNLDLFIEMRGGVINYQLQKELKSNSDPALAEEIDGIFDVARENWELWNPFSELLRTKFVPQKNLSFTSDTDTVAKLIRQNGGRLRRIEEFTRIIDGLAANHVLLDVRHDEKIYTFRFKNRHVQECIWESGSILEMNVYGKEKQVSDDCRVGVHLDWDGVVHDKNWEDVLNEIDVLSLNGNVATFISCKSGKMSGQSSLHALYELDTVARIFGGRYARKVLVSAQPLNDIYMQRAREMKIEVRSE